jgi:hypothetical protein
VGYPETFDELERWRDELRQTVSGDAIIRAFEDRISRESDPKRVMILESFLIEEHVAQGNERAAEEVRRRDPVMAIYRWHDNWVREHPGIDIIPALEARIRHESHPLRLGTLRSLLARQHRDRSDYAAAEIVYLAAFNADRDEPQPLILLAEQKLDDQQDLRVAMRVIDRAIEVAMRAGVFRRNALGVKARIALELQDYAAVEDVLRQIMALAFTRGNADIGTERDFFDRLPPGTIDPEVHRAYEEHCRAQGRARTSAQARIAELVEGFAKSQWLKVARIIGDVLKDCERNELEASEDAVADAVRDLVEAGRLEARGDISRWRYSEVKLAGVEDAPVIGTRTLILGVDGQEVEVPVTIYAPVDKEDHWRCEYEIGWPDKSRRGRGYGIDSVQALLIALHNIGAELYASKEHKARRLKWERPRAGYGFPLASGIRNVAVGDDKLM